MERLIIINGELILPTGIEIDKVMVCWNGKMEQIVSSKAYIPQADGRVINANQQYVSPRFIDMHVYGGGGRDLMDETVEVFLGVAETHARYGTAAMVPTTLTSTDEELMTVFIVYQKAKSLSKKDAQFTGLHLEGLYFSPKQCGAQDPNHLKTPHPDECNTILETSQDVIRWSIAPKLVGTIELGERLSSCHILPSIVHTDAIYEGMVEAYEAGYTHITHLYSTMSTITRKNTHHYAGAIETTCLTDDMTIEIIAGDIHLPKPLLQFVYKFRGADKTALCTDTMRDAGMPNSESILGSLTNGQKVVTEDGVTKLPDRSAFARSVAAVDRLVRTIISMANMPLIDATRMITLTPARTPHVDSQKGSLEEGKDADIAIFDN